MLCPPAFSMQYFGIHSDDASLGPSRRCAAQPSSVEGGGWGGAFEKPSTVMCDAAAPFSFPFFCILFMSASCSDRGFREWVGLYRLDERLLVLDAARSRRKDHVLLVLVRQVGGGLARHQEFLHHAAARFQTRLKIVNICAVFMRQQGRAAYAPQRMWLQTLKPMRDRRLAARRRGIFCSSPTGPTAWKSRREMIARRMIPRPGMMRQSCPSEKHGWRLVRTL